MRPEQWGELKGLEELRRLHARGELVRPLESIAHSVIHMHCNRILRLAQRTQELVIYEFLTRLYQSQLARQRSKMNGCVTQT